MKVRILALVMLVTVGSLAQTATEFQKVKQIISTRCTDCHDEETQKGGLNLEALLENNQLIALKTEKIWTKIEHAISSGEMPPKKKKPLDVGRKKIVSEWYKNYGSSTFAVKSLVVAA